MQKSFVSYPLRFRRSVLGRTDEIGALLQLIQIAARTPSGSWAGSAPFGFRNYLESRVRSAEILHDMTQRMNESLAELAMTSFVIKKLNVEGAEPGSRALEIEIQDLRSVEALSFIIPV